MSPPGDDADDWHKFKAALDTLIDEHVDDGQDAARAERILQARAQDMRESYDAPDHGRHA